VIGIWWDCSGMNRHSATAHELRLSLEAGIIAREEVIRWADEIMTVEDYDDGIAEICMASNKPNQELHALLAQVAGHEDEWEGTRRMLGRMHEALLREPARLKEFSFFLERIWTRSGYEVPEDMGFMGSVGEDYMLAEEGFASSVEEVRADLLAELARYR
jgi:hypothetical protein